jgi:hypothetical protein
LQSAVFVHVEVGEEADASGVAGAASILAGDAVGPGHAARKHEARAIAA